MAWKVELDPATERELHKLDPQMARTTHATEPDVRAFMAPHIPSAMPVDPVQA